jgi:cytidine deaminase
MRRNADVAASLAPELVEQLLVAAREAQSHAHAPYSRFKVGAAVLDEAGRIHAGCNVENAAYPLGSCAEALAIASMVRDGGREVKALLVLGDGEPLVTPCGGCRQRLREFAALDTPVLVANREHVRKRFTLEELLPASFGPENLSS